MVINYNNQDLNLRRCVRVNMIYEDQFGQSFDPTDIKQRDLVNLFIAAVIAAQEYQGLPTSSKEEVMKWCDDNPISEYFIGQFGHQWVNDFKNYLSLVAEYNKSVEGKGTNEGASSKTVKTSKKKS